MTKQLSEEFTIQGDFPSVDYDEWRSLAEAALHGAPFEKKLVTHTYEGFDVQPLYSRRDEVDAPDAHGFPGFAPFVRGTDPLGKAVTGWDLRQEHAHPDLSTTNRAIQEDLKGGVTSLLLRLDEAARRGLDPDQHGVDELAVRDGVMAYSVDDFDAAFADVHLNMIGVTLDAGAAFLPAAAMLIGLWHRRDISNREARGAFNADPLSELARTGQLPCTTSDALSSLASLAKWTADTLPQVTAVGVDSSPYHDAGATAAQDIAFAVATGIEYLRAMTDADVDIDTAARQILFRIGLGTHHFLAIAKLRAARRVWFRVVQSCGGSPDSGAMQIHARTSNRVLTQRDPYVNLLRNTVAVFAAGVGGANAISSVPFDEMGGLPDEFSRRVARNTVLVLQEEAHLHRVVDPAGGSWFIEQLTDQLAKKSWAVLQEIEGQGGMLAALRSEWVAKEIDAAYAPRARDIARRKEGITGVSEFPDVDEQRVDHAPIDTAVLQTAAITRVTANRQDDEAFAKLASGRDQVAAMVAAAIEGATIGQLARASGFQTNPSDVIAPLEPRSFAEPFEALRDASDLWQATRGQRPRVFLANMGPLVHHTARASYAKNFFEAGGFEVIGGDAFNDADAAATAFAESGANIAVICSSDKLYPDFVPEVAPKLKQAGARTVVLAGFAGENAPAWQAAGVDRFIFMKCDVLETLRELLQEEGVLPQHES